MSAQLGDDEPINKGSSTFEALSRDDVGQPTAYYTVPLRPDERRAGYIAALAETYGAVSSAEEADALHELRLAARAAKAAQEAAQVAAQRYAAAVKRLSEVLTKE